MIWDSKGFNWISKDMEQLEFQEILIVSKGFYGILKDFMGFYWILWDFKGFLRILRDFK